MLFRIFPRAELSFVYPIAVISPCLLQYGVAMKSARRVRDMSIRTAGLYTWSEITQPPDASCARRGVKIVRLSLTDLVCTWM